MDSMAKNARGKTMAKDPKVSKNLEALLKVQQIQDILKAGNVEGQAIMDSAGEQRPSDESHIVDLLEKRRVGGRNIVETNAKGKKAGDAKKKRK